MSVEIDVLPIADDNSDTKRLADLIEGVAPNVDRRGSQGREHIFRRPPTLRDPLGLFTLA